MKHLSFIGTREHGLGGEGKVWPSTFYDLFTRSLSAWGVECQIFENIDHFKSHSNFSPQVVAVLVYNEEYLPSRGVISEVLEVEQEIYARHPEALIIHPLSQGLIFGDKKKTNWQLRRLSVPTPKQVGSASAVTVFTNATQGSGLDVNISKPNTPLPSGSYNTEFVDTRHSYRDNEYYISLRAMIVGKTLVSAFPRARITSDGKPSVHNGDTPLDADLLNYLYDTFIINNFEELRSISEKIGTYAGPSFLALDILPCSITRNLHVCEVNFKFEDFGYRARLVPIIEKIKYKSDVDTTSTVRSAHAFALAVRECGFWA